MNFKKGLGIIILVIFVFYAIVIYAELQYTKQLDVLSEDATANEIDMRSYIGYVLTKSDLEEIEQAIANSN